MLSQKLGFDLEIILTLESWWTCANSNSEIVISVNKLVLSQKLGFDFEIILTLDELVLIQTQK